MSTYERLGVGYASVRRPDPRIATRIRSAIGAAGPVVNVGAGAGSYEPPDLDVIAVEPADTMLRQRPAEAAPAVRALAEALPFPAGRFAAGMAILTVHHWADLAGGLAELRRVASGPIVVLTWDREVFNHYWMVEEYVPASRQLDLDLPSPDEIARLLGGGRVEVIEVPADCTDGFYAAWWCRPEAYLNPSVRAGISGLARLERELVEPGIKRLAADLGSGLWYRRHARLLDLETYDAGYRLVLAGGPAPTGPPLSA